MLALLTARRLLGQGTPQSAFTKEQKHAPAVVPASRKEMRAASSVGRLGGINLSRKLGEHTVSDQASMLR